MFLSYVNSAIEIKISEIKKKIEFDIDYQKRQENVSYDT